MPEKGDGNQVAPTLVTWVHVAIICLLSSMLVQVFLDLIISFASRNPVIPYDIPWTFQSLWKVAFLVVLFPALKTMGVKDWTIILVLLVPALVICALLPLNSILPYRYVERNDQIRQISESDFRSDDMLGNSDYLFWQSGLAKGADPKYLKEYSANGFASRLELFATVGPLSIIEACIKGLLNFFFGFLLCDIVYYHYRNKHVFLLE